MKPIAILSTLSLASIAAVPCPAQAASYTVTGSACAQGGSPLRALTLPRIGQSLDLEVLSGFRLSDAGGISIVFTGASDQWAGGLRLPFDTSVWSNGPFHVWCGTLYASPDVGVLAPSQRGLSQPVTVRFPIANRRDLVGARFHQQVLRVVTTSLVRSESYLLSALGTGVIGL